MATYNHGINGPFKGKLGPAHGSEWKGTPYMKGPHKRRTKNISDKEKNNRIKFGQSQRWLQPITEFVREGFRGYSQKVEGFHAAKSLISHAFEGEGEDIHINPAYVLVSYGQLPLPENLSVTKEDPHTLKFRWDGSHQKNTNSQDQVMLLAYNVEKKSVHYELTGEFRKTGEAELRFLAEEGQYQIYVAFVSSDRNSRSNSRYLGSIEF